MPTSLAGVAEVADLLGVTPGRVHQLVVSRLDFPRPVAVLAAGRIWRLNEVERWKAKHPNRRPGRPRKGKAA